MDPQLARFTYAHQSVEQRRAMGKTDLSIPPDERIFMAGRPHGARDGEGSNGNGLNRARLVSTDLRRLFCITGGLRYQERKREVCGCQSHLCN